MVLRRGRRAGGCGSAALPVVRGHAADPRLGGALELPAGVVVQHLLAVDRRDRLRCVGAGRPCPLAGRRRPLRRVRPRRRVDRHGRAWCRRGRLRRHALALAEAGTLALMRLLLLADTHVPRRARDLPPQVWDEVDAADVVVHAGDWVDVALLDALEQRARRLIGVYGNNDGPPLRARLPEVARVELEGVRLAVVHETGQAGGRAARMEQAYPDVDVLVFGHSHIPWDTTTPRGLRLLNPGSPTDRRRQPACTYMTATVAQGRLGDVVLHALPPRTLPR